MFVKYIFCWKEREVNNTERCLPVHFGEIWHRGCPATWDQICSLKSEIREHKDIQENHWKWGMLPKCLWSIKGRTCNQTPLVHQDMTKKIW